jgi:DNA-binding LacI/PurR family transcriptional regulator
MVKVINYLGGLGHRSIGLISGDPRSSAIRSRLQAYIDGLVQWGIPLQPDLIVEGLYDPASGYTAASKLLSLSSATTAIISMTDRMAFGAWRYIRECGLSVPHDISLVGFDDIESSSLSPIGLTTVRLPKNEIGEKAAEILINQLTDKKSSNPVELVLPVELIVRDTCAPPRKSSDR